MSATEAVISEAVASSSSLDAARSSALRPTPLIDRAISSSVAAVASLPSASWAPSLRDSSNEPATCWSEVAFDSIERASWVATVLVSRCPRAPLCAPFAASSVLVTSVSTEERASSAARACCSASVASRSAVDSSTPRSLP